MRESAKTASGEEAASSSCLGSEKLPEVVVSQVGLPEDGVEGFPFQFFVVVSDSDLKSGLVGMSEEVVPWCGEQKNQLD